MSKGLSERRKRILLLAVRDYIEHGQPVASEILVQRYQLEFSPATVRNELAALTEMGLLRQPHTSAGRVPTEGGYRFFVTHLMENAELPEELQEKITQRFQQAKADVDEWMQLAAAILAHQSRAVSLVTAPHAEQVRFKHVELISTQGRQVLMVLVIEGGEISQQVLTLSEPVSQERLSQVTQRLNRALQGLPIEAISTQMACEDALEQDILTLIVQDMRRIAEQPSGQIYFDGLTNVLNEPEFIKSEELRHALRLLEERTLFGNLLARTVQHSRVGGLQVIIGGEAGWEELRQCSMVLARYGVPGVLTGALGVLGPMRMSYARTIPTVRFMASLLSNLVYEISNI
jgi:heat-inducible transcriptional repressor